MKSHRLYAFVNHIYMSPLQWGIQSGHAAVAMMARACEGPECARAPLLEWGKAAPTTLVLEGGNVATLLELEARLGELCAHLGLPFGAFREDQRSLGGVITCVAMLLPEELCSLRLGTDEQGRARFEAPPEGTLGDLGGVIDFSTIPGGLPLTETGNPELHELLLLAKTAKLA